MVNVIGQLLPLMVAVALSSVPMMVTVTILLAPRSGSSALLFLIGWLVGMFAVTGLLALTLRSVPQSTARRNQDVVGVVEIVLGLALIAYAIVQFLRGRRSPAQTELPRLIRSVGSIRPVPALGLGLLLNLRPKALLLATSAALILGTSRLPLVEAVVVLLVFVTVGGSTVTVPVVLALADADRMRRPLEATHGWLIRNSRTVTVIVLFVVGTFVLGDGMTRL
jgi:Sap, sulfolipid-1-addressing protein